MSAEELVMAAL